MINSSIFPSKSGITNISSRPNIIVADSVGDCADTAKKLAGILMREEINVIEAHSGEDALREHCPWGDWHMMIICDRGIAAPSFDMIERIRRFSDIPVMTVSDECSEIYRIMALDKGADVCMPCGEDFGSFEFKARILTMLRRYLNMESSFTCRSSSDTLVNGAIVIDRRRREVYSGGVPVRMTAIEYGIMEYLMENCGDVCSVDDIYRRVWREKPYSVRKTVVEHIRRIRSKIEPDPHNPSYIKVVFGIGYKMERAG